MDSDGRDTARDGGDECCLSDGTLVGAGALPRLAQQECARLKEMDPFNTYAPQRRCTEKSTLSGNSCLCRTPARERTTGRLGVAWRPFGRPRSVGLAMQPARRSAQLLIQLYPTVAADPLVPRMRLDAIDECLQRIDIDGLGEVPIEAGRVRALDVIRLTIAG